jgi:signal transduction histidine kinase
MSSVIRIRIFVLLSFIFSAGLIWYAWSRMQTNVDGLVQTVQESTMPDRNLVRIKELWIGFSTSGTGVKAFSVSRDDQLLEKFLQVKDSLNAVVDTLRKDAQQRGDDIAVYNEITLLLNEKETIYKDLIEINYNQVLTEAIEKMGDAEFTVDTLIANPDQGNFFQRMFSSRYSRKTMQARADSILVNRNRRIEEYQKNMKLIREEEARLLIEQSEKERKLLNDDQDVTSRIGSLILELENSERDRLVNHAKQEEFKAEKAGRGIRNIVYGGLVLFALLFLIIVIEVELANKRRKELAVAKIKAEKLAAAKEEFMATMSHEIRTPLTSIIGFSNKLLESDHHQEQSNRYLKAIQGSSAHLLAVVNDVLDYSRIESGKLKFSEESFRVDDVFKEVFDALLWKAEEKGIEFGLFIQPLTGLILHGDPVRLKQVLYNLAGNAIKFTEKGNVSLSATVINEVDNAILIFKVSDTGIGIPPDKLLVVFNEFEQGESSIEKKLWWYRIRSGHFQENR